MTTYVSPKSGSGSFLWSVIGHAFLYLALVVILKVSLTAKEAPPEYVNLEMQEFDSPPVPEKREQKVARSVEPQTPVVQPAKPDLLPRELQDEKSEVSGQQTAKPESNTRSESEGTAASTPYYKIKPKYPKAALIAQVEGWVLLQIDINEVGAVENIRVVGGEQRNMFEGEAKRAVSQYKYKPFIDAGGQPVRKIDHQVRVNFRLVDDES